MMVKIFFIFAVLAVFGAGSANAETFGFDKNEPILFPAGLSSADTLRSGEWQFAPLGWVFFGASDKLTIFWDWLLGLGGVPAGLIRYNYHTDKTWISSIEIHGVYFARDVDDQRLNEFQIEQKGFQGYFRINNNFRLSDKFKLYFTAGATCDTYQKYKSYKDKIFIPKLYENYWNPEAYAGFEYIVNSWLKFHANYGYGNTLLFFDAIPHKTLGAVGFNIAPFPRAWNGLMSRMRLEFNGMYVEIPDAEYRMFYPPVFLVAYWQWGAPEYKVLQ